MTDACRQKPSCSRNPLPPVLLLGKVCLPVLQSLRLSAVVLLTMLCLPASPVRAEEPPLRFYATVFSGPNPNFELFQATIETVRRAVQPQSVEFKQLPLKDLEREIKNGTVDLVLSGAGAYRRNAQYGLRDVATVVSPIHKDPNKAMGSVILVNAKRKDLRTLADLRGKSVALTFPHAFQGLQIALGEIASQGFDPDTFFGKRTYYGSGNGVEGVIQAVEDGTADFGIIRTCYLEDRAAQGRPISADVKVLGPKAVSGFQCLTSTELYPNWSLLITPSLTPAQIRRIVPAILTMPPTAQGLEWSVASDFSQVDHLLKVLKVGPYSYLREWTLKRLITQYWPFLAILFTMAFGVVLHSITVGKLVAIRTRQLEEALSKQKQLQIKVTDAVERFNRLQRQSTVQQMSSLVAHELGQPLSSILCYCKGISNLSEGTPHAFELVRRGTEKISLAARRAADIVDRVRSCAKTKTHRKETTDAVVLVRRCVDEFTLTKTAPPVPLGPRLDGRLAAHPCRPA